jgi:hypothetical protein
MKNIYYIEFIDVMQVNSFQNTQQSKHKKQSNKGLAVMHFSPSTQSL